MRPASHLLSGMYSIKPIEPESMAAPTMYTEKQRFALERETI